MMYNMEKKEEDSWNSKKQMTEHEKVNHEQNYSWEFAGRYSN